MNLEELSLVELNTQEVQEVDGGHEPCFWAGVASVAFPWIAAEAICYVAGQ
ncbi:class IIb bacteriocin, lactobin A/cerein 7B family [Flavobacterium sp. H4147]|uniref:class IIb bacteriocin, lactobin A/cerein 7B family n=1 Tax=Flavobacterium sp. H4147 TaxID=3034149 RepID=UPI0023EB44C8|nr:class IIb bacteriocin, lactobin A/cerein 7B family [Flavobacterium sp. H4147]